MNYNTINDVKMIALFNSLKDPVRIIDLEGNVVYTNGSMEKQFGNTIGKKCHMLFGSPEKCRNCICGSADFKSRIVERKARGKTFSVSSAPYVDDEGNITAHLEIFRDITDYINVRDRLLTSNIQMVKSMQLARRMQTTLMNTPMPTANGYVFHSMYEPCDAVGGDIFDCVMPDPSTVIMYVADVSGHGITAAMSTVFLKREVRAQCMYNLPLHDLVYRVQRSFLETNADSSLYLTLFAVKLDIHTGRFEYVNAGHTVSPVHINRGEYREIYAPGAPISTWFDTPEFGFGSSLLSPGDRLLLFTDGIEGAKFDEGVTLKDICKLTDVEELFSVLKTANKDNSDDFALLMCERIGVPIMPTNP